MKELFPLNFHKNKDDEFYCPILHKVFTDHTAIVAIRTSGHVYSKVTARSPARNLLW